MLTIFKRKQRIFLKIESPENRCSQLFWSTEFVKAIKSHPNIINEPTKPLQIINKILVLSCSIRLAFLLSLISKDFA